MGAQGIIAAENGAYQLRRMMQAIAKSGLFVFCRFGLPGQGCPVVIQVGHQFFHGISRQGGCLQRHGVVLLGHILQLLTDIAYQIGQQVVHNGMAIKHITFIAQAPQQEVRQAVDGKNMQIRIGSGFQVARAHIVLQNVAAGTAEGDQQCAALCDALRRFVGNQRGFAAAGHPFDQQGTIGVLVKQKRRIYHIENK